VIEELPRGTLSTGVTSLAGCTLGW
jgi:hypothetical protein